MSEQVPYQANSIMRVIGVDTPRGGNAQVMGGRGIANISYTGASAMNASFQAQQQNYAGEREALAAQSRASQAVANSKLKTIDAQMRMQVAPYQGRALEARAEAEQRLGLPIADGAGTGRGSGKNPYEEAQEKQGEVEYTYAQQEISELMLEGESTLRKGGGLQAYRKRMMAIVSKYPNLTPKQVRDLMGQSYGLAQDKTRESIKKTDEQLEELNGYKRQADLEWTRVNMQGLMKGFEYASNSDQREAYLGKINETVNGVLSSDKYSPIDRAFILKELLGDVVDSGGKSAELVQTLRNADMYATQVAELYQQRDEMSPAEWSFRESRLAQEYGIKGFRMEDSFYNEQQTKKTEQLFLDLEDISNQKVANSAWKLDMTRGAVGELAAGNATPAGIAKLKAQSKRYGNPPWMEEAIALAETMVGQEKDIGEFNTFAAGKRAEAKMYESSTLSQAIDMLSSGRGGKETEDAWKSLAAASLSGEKLEMFNRLVGTKGDTKKAGLTPEQEQELQQAWNEARRQATQSIYDQIDAKQGELGQKQGYIDMYTGEGARAKYQAELSNIPALLEQAKSQRAGYFAPSGY